MAGCFDLDCTNLVALVKLVLRLGFTAIGLRILEQTDFIDKEFWSTRPTLWPGRAGRAAYHQVRVLPALESRAARAHFGSRAQEPYCHFLVTSLQQRIQAARLHNITRGYIFAGTETSEDWSGYVHGRCCTERTARCFDNLGDTVTIPSC